MKSFIGYAFPESNDVRPFWPTAVFNGPASLYGANKLNLSTFFLLLLLAGCASSNPTVWYQTGKSPAEAHRDLADAKLEARKLDHPAYAFSPILVRSHHDKGIREFIKNSMMAKGYLLTAPTALTNATQYPKAE